MVSNLNFAILTTVGMLVKYAIWSHADTSTQLVMALLIGPYLLACLEHWRNNQFFIYRALTFMWHIESMILAVWGVQVSVFFLAAVMLLLLCWWKYLDDFFERWRPTEKDSHTVPSSFLAIVTFYDGVSWFNTEVDIAPGDDFGESRKVSEMDSSVIREDFPVLPNIEYDDFASTPNLITDEEARKGAFAMEDKLTLMVAYFGGKTDEHTLPMSESDSDSDGR